MDNIPVNMFLVPQQQNISDSSFRPTIATRPCVRACWSNKLVPPCAKRVLKTPILPHRARQLRHAPATLGTQAAVRAQGAQSARGSLLQDLRPATPARRTQTLPHRARPLWPARATLGFLEPMGARVSCAQLASTKTCRAVLLAVLVRATARLHRRGARMCRNAPATRASSGRPLAQNAARVHIR